MNDGDGSSVRLAELLRHPDDLDKIPALKSDFTRKKTAIDAQLKLGLKEQLQLTQAGMNSLENGQKSLNLIKEEMIKIDKLCAESQNLIRNFPEINAVAQAHRNFSQVLEMKNSIETFNDRLEEINRLIREDEEDLMAQPNLIQIHYELTQLRNIRDEAMDQVKRADDSSLEGTLSDHFKRLDDAIEDFDEHVGTACTRLIPLVTEGNTSLVVRLAVIVEEEEKFDNRIRELQEAQRDYKDLATRFKSLATGPKEMRGYKEKFLEAIKMYGEAQIDDTNETFMQDPDKLEKSVRWFFNDLNTVKLGMHNLMPKKWRIFRTYVKIYHKIMYDFLKAKAEDKECTPTHMLAIIHWKDKYLNKMERLGANPADLEPPLPGGRDGDLGREYRQLIIDKVDEWMNQMNKNDKKDFADRNENALDRDEHGHFRTKSLSDMWRMLQEQLAVAATSEIAEITEAVIDAIFRSQKARIDMWSAVLNREHAKYSQPQSDNEGLQGLQDWLVALAGDQLAVITQGDDTDPPQLGYLHSFRESFRNLVSQEYNQSADERVTQLSDGHTTLLIQAITVFSKLIIAVDFRTIMSEFFTATWYTKSSMGPIISTYEDYLGDYSDMMSPLIRDILIEEMSKQLLFGYLSCVRNKATKVRDIIAFDEGLKADVSAVFRFFDKFGNESVQQTVRRDWEAVRYFNQLISCDKGEVSANFSQLLHLYHDVKLSWVEAVLRMRPDTDFGPLGDGKTLMKGVRSVAAERRHEGEPTVMAEVD